MELPKLPEVKFTKNGYEIRAEVLALATAWVQKDYEAKFAGWSAKVGKDEKTGQIVTTVGMPEFPGLETILQTAEKMYGFINKTK
jgi:hypothetical protein